MNKSYSKNQVLDHLHLHLTQKQLLSHILFNQVAIEKNSKEIIALEQLINRVEHTYFIRYKSLKINF